jgi:hypothetical protein
MILETGNAYILFVYFYKQKMSTNYFELPATAVAISHNSTGYILNYLYTRLQEGKLICLSLPSLPFPQIKQSSE